METGRRLCAERKTKAANELVFNAKTTVEPYSPSARKLCVQFVIATNHDIGDLIAIWGVNGSVRRHKVSEFVVKIGSFTIHRICINGNGPVGKNYRVLDFTDDATTNNNRQIG